MNRFSSDVNVRLGGLLIDFAAFAGRLITIWFQVTFLASNYYENKIIKIKQLLCQILFHNDNLVL